MELINTGRQFTNGDAMTVQSFENEQAFLQKVGRIVTGNMKLAVKTITCSNELAFVEGSNIHMNFEKIWKDTFQNEDDDITGFVGHMKALCWHELMHQLWTTYDYQAINDWTHKNQEHTAMRSELVQSLNLLEDTRVETFGVSQFPRLKDYFMLALCKWILSTNGTKQAASETQKGANHANNLDVWALLYGRKFVPLHLVREAEAKLAGDDLSKLKIIIDTYGVTTDVQEQVRLANEFYNERKKITQLDIRASSQVEQKKLGKNKKQIDKKKLQDAHDAQAQQQQKDDKQKNDSADAQDGNDDDAPSTSSASAQPKNLTDAIKNTIKNVMEKEGETLMQEARDINSNDFGFGVGSATNTTVPDNNPIQTNASMRTLAEKLRATLKQIRSGLEAKVVRDLPHGRLDVKKLMASRGTTVRVFNKREPSRIGKSRLAVSFCIDSSSSMKPEQFDVMLRAAWALNQALENNGDAVQVLQFDNKMHVAKQFGQKQANWSRMDYGNTYPLTTLQHARASLNTQATHMGYGTKKLCVVFTDGDWMMSEECTVEITKMRKNGIYVLIVSPEEVTQKHGANALKNISDYEQINGIMNSVVRELATKVN